MAIGWQRARSHKAVGMRTLGLIGLGSALATCLVSVSTNLGAAPEAGDLSRVLQGILAGVGFLGAGVILHARGIHRVHGLTPGAAIWFTALLGTGAGTGQFAATVLATGAGVAILIIPEGVDR
jgi:putative Mg2+ transporter-C (MgtC) family protein